jgi:hypothetical protein
MTHARGQDVSPTSWTGRFVSAFAICYGIILMAMPCAPSAAHALSVSRMERELGPRSSRVPTERCGALHPRSCGFAAVCAASPSWAIILRWLGRRARCSASCWPCRRVSCSVRCGQTT